MKTVKSLQSELSRWIILAASLLMVIGGLVSSGIAFMEAREIQDSLLQEIGMLVQQGYRPNKPTELKNQEGEEISLLIQPLEDPSNQSTLVFSKTLKNGLQTVTLGDEPWRVLVIELADEQRHYIIAQPTELRDDLAVASGLNVFLPMLVLVGLMLLLVRWIIRYQFKPLKQLAAQLHHQDASHPEPLPQQNVPAEIYPFVESINSLLERIRHSMNRQQRFIADAAHELRTPVTALSLLVENVKKATSPQDQEERQQQVETSLQRLRSLLNQLLDMARLQSEQQSTRQAISFTQRVQQVIADLHPLAEQKQIDLGVVRMEALTVLDQDERLRQLVFNAIDNAIRYTPEGGQVNISLFEQNKKAIFRVEDTGEGIPENALHEVFEPFYRYQHNDQPGNGLGLAISQEIARHLGGAIQLQNRQEGGLQFTYTQAVSHE